MDEQKESIEQYQKEIASLKKNAMIIRIVAYGLFTVGLALFIIAVILALRSDSEEIPTNVVLLSEGSSVLLSAALALAIIRVAVFNTRIRNRLYRIEYLSQVQNINNDPIPPMHNQKELDLVEQYRNLLNQGLITQEDFDKKKAEILGYEKKD